MILLAVALVLVAIAGAGFCLGYAAGHEDGRAEYRAPVIVIKPRHHEVRARRGIYDIERADR